MLLALDLPGLAVENASHDWPANQRLFTSTLLDSPPIAP